MAAATLVGSPATFHADDDASKVDGNVLGATNYYQSVKPNLCFMYRVLVRKTFTVALRRHRILWAMIQPVILATTSLLLWWLLGDAFEENELLMIFRSLLPMLLGISLHHMSNATATDLLFEKESKMKVVQLVNGVPPWLYWAAHCTYLSSIAFISTIVWTIFLSQGALSGVNVLFIFTIVFNSFVHGFGTSMIVSTIIPTVEAAGSFGGVTLLIGFLPIALTYVKDIPAFVFYLTGFLPNNFIAWWINAVLLLKLRGFNFTWDGTFSKAPEAFSLDVMGLKESPPGGYLFLFSFFQTSAWLSFAYWLDQVWQSDHGAARAWDFCIRRKRSNERKPLAAANDCDWTGDPQKHAWGGPALQVNRLTKIFKRGGKQICCFRKGDKEFRAVDDMTFHVNAGELFGLLGHNGAGKTTAINCIIGMVPITSGEIHVLGVNCAEDLTKCRQNLSVCPQDNPMYPELTVEQHLHFFSELRGNVHAFKAEVDALLSALSLTEKRTSRCDKLSGGQKRRLWVATCLMGKAPVVFLDEPTSGMDPSSRRELWGLLSGMKRRGRSVIFTTHYLEEADVLADRKAVLAEGKVKALGTSKELKMQFGAGYRLKLLIYSTDVGCREDLVRVVQDSVQGARAEAVAGVERTQAADALREMRFILPYSEVSSFGGLFDKIEALKKEGKVDEYELGMTSLEDVFMALAKDASADAGKDGEDIAATVSDVLPEEDCGDFVKLTTHDYRKVLFLYRLLQASVSKVFALGISVPIGMTIYGVVMASGFFTHNNLLNGVFGIYPGFVIGSSMTPLFLTFVFEREAKVRHVMISQGLPQQVYWTVTAALPMLQGLLVSFPCVIAMVAMDQHMVVSHGRLGVIIFMWLLSPFPVALWFYNFSFFFSDHEKAGKAAMAFVSFIGMFGAMVPNMLWNVWASGAEEVDLVASCFHLLLSFCSPLYNLSGALIGAYRAAGSQEVMINKQRPTNEEAAKFIAHWALWIPVVGQICLTSTLLALAIWRNRAPGSIDISELPRDSKFKDEDVLAEEQRVKAATPDSEACIYQDLHHCFKGKGGEIIHAVRGISLGVRKGECFGLLGPNGAGKTTTLSCLTGELRPPTSGHVFLAGHSVTGDGIDLAYQHLGHCPQVDALHPLMTGRDQLAFYGRIKGVPEGALFETVDRLLNRLGISKEDGTKISKMYSGGMKRKLCLAFAIIGRSDVLFLDEPSAGVDAGAKRLLWQVLKLRSASKTVVITTHSMEEAEAICDRMAIQVSGQLRCLGTSLHLKTQYGSGYQIEIRLQKSDDDDPPSTLKLQEAKLTQHLQATLSSNIQLLEGHEGCYVYQLPSFNTGELHLGRVFSTLHAAREFGIEDYCICQPTLEQVFLRFARAQDEHK